MARLALTFGALFAFLGCHFGQHPSLTSSPKPPGSWTARGMLWTA